MAPWCRRQRQTADLEDVDITVTSVLQTTRADDFGRFDERVHTIYDKGPHSEKHASAPRAGGARLAQPGS